MRHHLQHGGLGRTIHESRVSGRLSNSASEVISSSTNIYPTANTELYDSGQPLWATGAASSPGTGTDATFLTPEDGWYLMTFNFKWDAYPGTTNSHSYNNAYIAGSITGQVWQHEHYAFRSLTTDVGRSFTALMYNPRGQLAFGAVNQFSQAGATIQAGSLSLTMQKVGSRSPRVAAYVTRSATQSIANATDTAIAFTGTVVQEGGAFDSGSNTRLTVPTGGAGWYVIAGYVQFLSTTTGRRTAYIRRDGTTDLVGNNQIAVGGTKTPNCAIAIYLPDGAYVELMAVHNQGTSLNVTSSSFGMVRICGAEGIGGSVLRTTTQSVAAASSAIASFTSEVRDDGGCVDVVGSPTKITVPTGGAGFYYISAWAHWTALSTTQRGISITVNGAADTCRGSTTNLTTNTDPRTCCQDIRYLADGDYVEAVLINDHTTTANTTQASKLGLSMVRLHSVNIKDNS